MVGGHLDCDIGLQCVVCPIDHRPTIIPFLGRLSANYQFVYGSIIDDDMPTIDRPLVNSSTTMDKN